MAAKKPAESESGASSDATSSSGSASEVTSSSGSTSESSASSSDETSDAPAKGKTGKNPAAGRSGKVSARPARISAAVAAATAKPRGSGHELIPVICSECYEEFIFDSGVPAKVLTCPVCEHQAARPDDALLHKINDLRSKEKMGLMMSVGFTALGALLMLMWVVLTKNPHNQESGIFWATLGGGLVMFLAAGGVGAAKYESQRHETYF